MGDAALLVSRLQHACRMQEEEAQRNNAFQMQRIEDLATKLKQAEIQIRILQDERDGNIMNMGNAAAAELHLDKERADLQRIKAELLCQREDICAARSFFAAQQLQELERARKVALQGGELGPEELASFRSAIQDFEDMAQGLEAVLRSRAAYK
ncbi:hypothetical protein DUNSADRAFT_11149 [Dunaliella salina]|uniref:Uncharacterized protein n=1 Tax=Dunaliella salina TaxID=3046 RepID=A0ABQ7GE07_DUNSA|nr:hypothetical protein DUNSADRAFT_11149 [Dunaliella salina]|eukprot:KAF5832847.1 hypothetical protein DUNSADRAFT_11149 [Dunaliella salina]